MVYKNYISDPSMTGENRLSPRTLLLPAQKKGITHKNFTASDRILLLNGTWQFSYVTEDSGEAFFLPGMDDASWDSLPVPSMWQYFGYGTCLYPNTRYAFPYDPPYIHGQNPVGLYRYRFTASHSENGRILLRFGGVENAYFVWLNGEYVGFSKGSRLAAEYDVTDLFKDGENLLAVKVYTYSDASYLEGQDMLLANGIFRDVMLIFEHDNSLWDYTLLPDEKGFAVTYSCTVGKVPAELKFTLCDMNGAVMSEYRCALTEAGEVFLPLASAITWNAERPYLYTLYVEVLENGTVVETHTKRAGIAKSQIDGDSLMLNGVPITLKGVNRHEHHPKSGRAITSAQIERELYEIKANGLNAIRCSHYTNQPVFYELASEIGLYVMDEADLESHGAEAAGDRGIMAKDPAWFDAFFDRISRMYALNKNETCIHIWSLGNEYGSGENEQKCAVWLAEQVVKKPIRGDGDPTTDRGAFRQISYMSVKKHLQPMMPNRNGPILIVEYAHAMGNSPGGLEDIWNWIYEHEYCCGGYVWEYKNHGFYAEGKDGAPRYLYGGDFPDYFHMSNFSLDGFHTSDGTPKPVWFELGEIFAPVYVVWGENGVKVKNTNDFTALDGIMMRWSVKADGVTVRNGDISLDGLAPRQWKEIPLPTDTEGMQGCVTLDCEFYCGDTKIAHKQKILADIPATRPPLRAFEHTVSSFDRGVMVSGQGFSLEIRNGLLSKLVKNGHVVLDAPMSLNCWRAYIDNECGGFGSRVAGLLQGKLVHSMIFSCTRLQVEDSEEAVTVTVQGKYLPVVHNWGFNVCIIYRLQAECDLDIALELEPYGDAPEMVNRMGVCFRLPEAYTRCAWLGRGPSDNYPDRKANAPVGNYAAEIDTMNFLYDVPQETGNRGDCRHLEVSDGVATLCVDGKFSFSLHDFSQMDLYRARHRDELNRSKDKYLYIDHVQRGLGSESCGPCPEQEYEIPMQTFRWSFHMRVDTSNRA
ncbi:MAG: hypothetical protein J6J01_07150 [Oscillospiraceae bacterium]|nr:hypothetical protein [Oscillospiraceae bacterium]